MSRPRPHDRFARLVDAALTVFADRGLAKTRMSDIATELGVSAGTLYNYVEGKDALFLLLLEYGLDDAPPTEPSSYPVATPSKDQLWKRLEERLLTYYQRQPCLARALDQPRADDAPAELREILGELYDLGSSRSRWINLLERSAADVPQIADLFLVKFRRSIVDRLERYLIQRMEHEQLRVVTEPRVAARYVLEVITTFARRLQTASPTDTAVTSREHVLDLLVATFTL